MKNTVAAKFIDGPLAGQTLEVPKGTERFLLGPIGNPFWIYTYAGKEGRTPLFGKLPKERRTRRMVMWYIGKFGRDPRAERAASLKSPTKRTAPSKHGQGARRRAEKRVSNAA